MNLKSIYFDLNKKNCIGDVIACGAFDHAINCDRRSSLKGGVHGAILFAVKSF